MISIVFACETPVKDTTNVLDDFYDQSNSDEEQFLECASSFTNPADTNLENSLPANTENIEKFKSMVFSTPKISKDESNQSTNNTFETFENTASSKPATSDNTINVSNEEVNNINLNQINEKMIVVNDDGIKDNLLSTISIKSEILNSTFEASGNVELETDINELNVTENAFDTPKNFETPALDSLANDLEKLKINTFDTEKTDKDSVAEHQGDENVKNEGNYNETFETVNNFESNAGMNVTTNIIEAKNETFNNTFDASTNANAFQEFEVIINQVDSVENEVTNNTQSQSINVSINALDTTETSATTEINESVKELEIPENCSKNGIHNKTFETLDDFKENSANELNSIKNDFGKLNKHVRLETDESFELKAGSELNLSNQNSKSYKNENVNINQPEATFDTNDKNLKNEKNSFLIESELQELHKSEKSNDEYYYPDMRESCALQKDTSELNSFVSENITESKIEDLDSEIFDNPFKKPSTSSSSQNNFSGNFPDTEFTQGNNCKF